MNLDELKGKTIDDALHGQLVEFVKGLEVKVQTARDESISHRKGLKARIEDLERINRTAFDKLGVDSPEDLEALPDAKGQAEALRQFETRLKRAERERDEARNESQTIKQQRDAERRSAAIAKAVSKHSFVDPDVATMLIEHGAVQEGDELMFKAEGGKLVPLEEGAAWVAKTKPHLVKAQGGTGSGYRPNGNGNGAPGKTMTRAEFDALSQDDRMAASLAKTVITD